MGVIQPKEQRTGGLPAQGPCGVWAEHEGEAHWQPEPAHGHVTLKITPDTFPSNLMTVGFQYIDEGCALRDHGHRASDELLFVWGGHGTAYLDGVPHKVEPGSLVYVGRFVKHGFVNEGKGQLKLMWVITPPGLEHAIRGMGRPKEPGGNQRPGAFERPPHIRDILDRAGFARPETLVPGGSGR
jgi:quercetin dioxygenase-like cupin family protein